MKKKLLTVLVAAAIGLNGNTGTKAQIITRYSCIASLTTLHQDPGPSFINHEDRTMFQIEIGSAEKHDNVWCDTEIHEEYDYYYCKTKYRAKINNTELYGNDNSIFRGKFPYDYLIIFNDKSFMYSSGATNGVLITSGQCSQ